MDDVPAAEASLERLRTMTIGTVIPRARGAVRVHGHPRQPGDSRLRRRLGSHFGRRTAGGHDLWK